MALDESTLGKTGAPAGVLPEIVITVKYETAPGEVRAGVFAFRHPTLGDEATITTRAATFAAPARLVDLPEFDQEYLRAVATISVMVKEPPDWYKVNTPEVRQDLPLAVYSRFLGDRGSLFRVTNDDGKVTKAGPILEIVSSVG